MLTFDTKRRLGSSRRILVGKLPRTVGAPVLCVLPFEGAGLQAGMDAGLRPLNWRVRLAYNIPLPLLPGQRRIVTELNAEAAKLEAVGSLIPASMPKSSAPSPVCGAVRRSLFASSLLIAGVLKAATDRTTTMLFERQRLLLALTEALGGTVPQTDFQKLLFFYSREWEQEPSYEFVPYQYGGFSFTSYADKRRLIEKGLLADDDHHWQISEAGRKAVAGERALRERTGRFARTTSLRGDALVADQYRRFPYYAVRSRIVNRVLEDAVSRRAVEQAKPQSKGAGLVTIGYEGKSLERYLNQLLRDGVTMLCDVRRNPLSRKYGFSKSTLSKACEGVGIRYEHLPELGIASEERRDLKTQADYDALFAEYERKSLPHQGKAVDRIGKWVAEGERVALTCYEALPCQCHRHCVAEAVEAARKLKAVHL
jgi:hypothetical protein